MRLLLFILSVCFISATSITAQVSINEDGSDPDSSAILDLKSNNKGFLPPRLTNTERDAIESPATGLIVYNTSDSCVQMYNGTAWVKLNYGDNIPSPPGTITGLVNPLCEESGVTYSISPVSGAISYHWTVPGDANIVSGQSTTGITVDFGVESGNISVRAGNDGGNSGYTSLAVAVGILDQPGSISGTTCVGLNSNGISYSISPVAEANTYHWTVPTDATIASGQGTASITVDFGTESGTIAVRAENNCDTTDYTTQSVSVGVPDTSGEITGDAYPDYAETGIVYSIDSVTEALSYHWTVPDEASIVSGQGTVSITVDFGSESGDVCVRAQNNCGNGSYKCKAITVGPWSCGIPVYYEGQTYNTVEIGSQCWMAENLNVGTRINGSSDQTDNDTIEKYCYDNNTSNCDTYGGLYQWDEMMDYVITEGTQGICPTGWHLPTDAEWMTLEEEVESTTGVNWYITCSWRGTDAGSNLKETSTLYWEFPNAYATNSSGFTGLPGGQRHFTGSFVDLTMDAKFWTSSENGTSAWLRTLFYCNAKVNRCKYGKTLGYSVRCLKD